MNLLHFHRRTFRTACLLAGGLCALLPASFAQDVPEAPNPEIGIAPHNPQWVEWQRTQGENGGTVSGDEPTLVDYSYLSETVPTEPSVTNYPPPSGEGMDADVSVPEPAESVQTPSCGCFRRWFRRLFGCAPATEPERESAP